MHIVGTMWSVDLCIKYVSLNISKAFCLTGMMMHTYEPWYDISVCVYSIHWWNQFPYPRISIWHRTACHHVLIPGLQLLGLYLWQPQILLLSAKCLGWGPGPSGPYSCLPIPGASSLPLQHPQDHCCNSLSPVSPEAAEINSNHWNQEETMELVL